MDTEKIKELGQRAIDDEPYASALFPPSMYYRFLKLLAREMKPRLSVELGVCGGGGSLHLSLGHPEGIVIGIDIQNDYPKNIQYIENVCEEFHFLKVDSIEGAKQIPTEEEVDILFIDTNHTYSRTLDEFYAWYPLMREGGVVCFDDILRHHPDDKKSMEDAWNEIPGDKIRLDHLHDGTYPHGGGFGVAIV